MTRSTGRALLLLLLLHGSAAHAQYGDAIASGVAGGLMGGLGSTPPSPAPGLYHAELPDWIDPATGSSSRLNAGCGVVVQTTLTGTATTNFLNVIVSNHGAGPVQFDAASVEFVDGPRRAFSGPIISVEERGFAPTTLPFADKRDFEGRSSLIIELAFLRGGRPCSIRLRHDRTPGSLPDPRTAFEYSSLEFWFGAGVSLGSTGAFEELHGDLGLSMSGGVFAFPWIHHGFGMEVLFEAYDSSAATEIAPGREFVEHVNASSTGLTFGYAVRLYPLPWLSVSYAPTAGAIYFELADDNGIRESAWAFAFRQRLQLEARFVSFRDGTELYFAPALAQTLVPSGALGDLALRGSHLSALLFLAVGG